MNGILEDYKEVLKHRDDVADGEIFDKIRGGIPGNILFHEDKLHISPIFTYYNGDDRDSSLIGFSKESLGSY
jgi:hypothetical protein